MKDKIYRLSPISLKGLLLNAVAFKNYKNRYNSSFNNYLKENPDASGSTTINEILTDDQYRKLSNVINAVDKDNQQSLYTFEIHNLFQKDFKFPPHRNSLNRTTQAQSSAQAQAQAQIPSSAPPA
jgi:hypothetical protein